IMNAFIFIVLLFSSTVPGVVSEEWSEWTLTPNSPCSDVCGYCGVRVTAVRTCHTLMKCSGIAQKYEECAPKMCPFPRKTCCAGYVKGVPGPQFECVAATATLAAKTKLT
ncbi:hypothetical protein PENTCL1PPCAC_12785, partial [Pristionchus entomophagus]